MINLLKCTSQNEKDYFDFLRTNESNLNVLYNNNNKIFDHNNKFNDIYDYFFIYDEENLIGVLKTYELTLIIDNTELKSGGASLICLLKGLNPYCFDAVLDRIDDFFEEENFNIALLSKDIQTYRKYHYWPLGTIRKFEINRDYLSSAVSFDSEYIVKIANLSDIELLNEFYVDNLCYNYRNQLDWADLIKNSKYKYYICTNGEGISYAAYCNETKEVVEVHGDLDCLGKTLRYLFDEYKSNTIYVLYNDIDLNISRSLYEYCNNCSLQPITNMHIYNSTDTYNKLSYLIERQGYKFDNLSYEDEEELCIRVLGFEYMPSNRYQFVKPTNVNLSIADLK